MADPQPERKLTLDEALALLDKHAPTPTPTPSPTKQKVKDALKEGAKEKYRGVSTKTRDLLEQVDD